MANGDSSPDYDTAQPVPLAGLVTGMTPPQPIPRPPPPPPADDLVYRPGQGPPPQAQPMPFHPGQDQAQVQQLPYPAPQPPQQLQQFPDGIQDLIRQYAPTPFRPPFQRAMPRPFGQWGRNSWFLNGINNYPAGQLPPGMPSFREALGLITSAGQSLGTWGPQGVAQPAMQAAGLARLLQNPMIVMGLDIASKGAFSRNRLAAQQGQIRLMQEQMQLKADQAVEQANAHLREYDRIYTAWNLGAFGKPGTPEADQAAEDAVERLAIPDPNIHAILKNGGLNAVEEYLKHMDTQAQDMAAGAASARKSSKDGGVDPYIGSSGLGEGIPHHEEARLQKPDTETGTPAEPAPATAVPHDTPAARNDYIRKTYNHDAIDAQIRKDAHIPADAGGMEAARAALGGTPGAINSKFRGAGNALQAEQALRAKIDQAVRDSNLSTPESKLNAINQIDGNFGGNLRSLRDYKIRINELPSASRTYYSGVLSQIDRNWDDGNFANVHRFSNPDAAEFRLIARTQETPQVVRNLWQAVNDTQAKGLLDKPVPQRVLEAWWAGRASGDPEYDQLYNAINGMSANFAAVMRGTGMAPAATMQAIVQHMPPTASYRSIMEQARQDFNNIWAQITTYQDLWTRTTGRNTLIPGVTPDNWNIYSALARANWDTGTLPTDAPDELLAVTRPISASPASLPPDKRFKPLTNDEYIDIKNTLDKYRNYTGPDAEDVHKKLQILRKRLPSTLNPAKTIPQAVASDEAE